MVKKKHKSKRISLGLKYKVEAKCKQFKKKANKVAKKNKLNGIKAPKKKNPGIPNAWPFKAELLRECEVTRIRAEDAKEKAAEEKKTRRRENRQMYRDLAAEEEAKAAKEEEENPEVQEEKVLSAVQLQVNAEVERLSATREQLQKLQQTVDASDILLYVLDARDPLGSRLLALEEDIAARGKKVVLVLNKATRVPSKNLEAWTRYLSVDHPVVLMDSTANISSLDYYKLRSGAVDSILQLVKAYMNPKMAASKVPTVGIIGYEHAGAPAVLEAMEGKFVHMAEFEEPLDTMHTDTPDARLRVLNYTADIPNGYLEDGGTVQSRIFAARGRGSGGSEEAVEAVTEVIDTCCAKEQLMELYRLAHFAGTEEFLDGFARKIEGDKQESATGAFAGAGAGGGAGGTNFRGKGGKSKDGSKQKRAARIAARSRLIKKGVVDVAATASVLLSGWANGRFHFYSTLPEGGEGSGGGDKKKKKQQRTHSWLAVSKKDFAPAQVDGLPCVVSALECGEGLAGVAKGGVGGPLDAEECLLMEGVGREEVSGRMADVEAEIENVEEQLRILMEEGEDEEMAEAEEAEEEEAEEEEEDEEEAEEEEVKKPTKGKRGQAKAKTPVSKKQKKAPAKSASKKSASKGGASGAYDFNADFDYD
jgi:nuclear GTP-binding protein